ncbi:hypothetical protein FRC12_015871 [Ceratobasidium sp. 428]|nr:hypothetical protein FRC12_015871 [Ceratobasidium sp. 428]
MSIFDSQSQRQLISRYIGDGAQVDVSVGAEDVNMELSPEDRAIDLELESIEEQFLAYRQSPLNIAELRFNVKERSDTFVFPEAQSLELDELLDYLPMVFPSTKKLVHRAQGYQRLINILRNLQCSTDGLITRRSDLLTIISTELDRLLTGATEELKAQATMGTHHEGARRIQFASSSGKCASPIVMASVVLIAIIHCMMGVAREHCNLILKCLRCILQLVANMQDSRAAIFASNHINPIPITLPTALHYLGLQDDLEFYVACPSCDTLYKLDTEPGPPDRCSNVNIDGNACNTALFTQHRRGNRT